MSEPGVRIGEAAALYGLAPSAVRWWEKQGALGALTRRGTRRHYTEQDLRRLGLTYLCRVIGRMSLKSAVVAASTRTDNQAWQSTITTQLDHLTRQIQELEEARTYLTALLRCPSDDPSECPTLDQELLRRTPRGEFPASPLITAARTAARSTHRPTPRDENTPPSPPTRDKTPPTCCHTCNAPLTQPPRGRPRRYCSPACRQRAYRTR